MDAGASDIERRVRERDAWLSARGFDDLLQLGSQFLLGRIAHFPGWGAPDTDAETDAIRDELVALHRLGLLTTASQPAFEGHVGGRAVRRRAFVLGFARPELARRLAAARTSVVRAAFPDGSHAPTTPWDEVPLTLEDGIARLVLGTEARAAELALFAGDLGIQALRELAACAYVEAFDPVYGRADRLWPELLELGHA